MIIETELCPSGKLPDGKVTTYEQGLRLGHRQPVPVEEASNTSPTNIMLGEHLPTASIPVVLDAPHVEHGADSRDER